MKVWIYILSFAVSRLTALAQTGCPPEHFSAVIVASIDQTVPPDLIPDDPELNFFKKVMKFDEDEIQDAFEYATHFYNES